MSEQIEKLICKVDDLQIKEKKVFRIEDTGIVVYRKSEQEFVAFGNKCSHYGAPLINGVIYNDSYVICPWHAACFNIETGDIEEFPGCDNIPTFSTYIQGNDVYLKAPKSCFVSKVRKPLSPRKIINRSVFLIIGGGPAGFQCAQTLRQEGFNGRVVLVSNEDAPPYDRTKLSKNLSAKIETLVLRNEDYYNKEAQIELILKTNCKKLDVKSQLAYLDDGSNLHYDKMFIATGSRPRKYDPSLDHLKNVYYLRTYLDANDIHANVEGKNVLLIGSSFIAIEIACSVVKQAKSVSVISRSKVPFMKTLGSKIGEAIKKILIEKNVKFYHCTSKLQFISDADLLKTIKSDQFELPVDICVFGIGSIPNTEFLKDSKEIKLANSFIEVNQKFQTSVENVYAGGDVVIYPNLIYNNQLMNIQHWQTAQAHGRLASFHMLHETSITTPNLKSVPFFWSSIFGKGIRFSGIVDDPDNCLIDGDLDQLSFVAYYFNKDDQAIGMATMSRDPIASAFAALLRDNKILTKQNVLDGSAWFDDCFH